MGETAAWSADAWIRHCNLPPVLHRFGVIAFQMSEIAIFRYLSCVYIPRPRCKIRLVDALPHRVVTSQWWSPLGVASIAKRAKRCYWLLFTWCFLSVKNNFCTANGTRQMDGRCFFSRLLFNCRKLIIINYITLILLIKSITIVLKKILNIAIINVYRAPTEGFPWDDLRKIFSECRRKITAENFNRLSRAQWRTNVTDRRRTERR